MQVNIKYLFIFTFCISFCNGKKYYNYTLYRAIPVEEYHLDYLKNLSKIENVDFWREPGLVYNPVDFVVGPEEKPKFVEEAEKIGLYLTTMREDVQKAFDAQTVKSYIRRKMDSFDWENYFRVDDIYRWLADLASTNQEVMVAQSIGKSAEDRDIMAVRIALKGSKLRSTVIIEGGIHAREWISPAFVTFLIKEVLHSPTSANLLLKEVAMNYEWFFVPVLNPDGYEYSHTHDRSWRKNRNPTGAVDLNRNFDNAFGTVGVSHNKQSNTYCGTNAFSEPESKAMKSFVDRHSKNLEFYFAFHSYGQYMIIPYANSLEHHGNFKEVKEKCNLAAKMIAARYKTQYTVGTAYDTVGYLSSGVSGCWVKHAYQTPYVVTFELRDTGTDGFALPPNKIMPTCEETMDGILTLLAPNDSLIFKRLRDVHDSADHEYMSDKFVIFLNLLLFILVRSD